MSDENTPPSEEAPTEEFEKPKVRRISNKNPRKTAKEKEEAKDAENTPSAEDKPAPQDDAPAGAENAEEPKRNNRRRRGKKTAKDAPEESSGEETINLGDDESPAKSDENNSSRGQGRNPRKGRARVNVDPEKVANKAWKIYLAEVSEEGVALIADNDARELSRRCFRLAEIFLEEEQRKN